MLERTSSLVPADKRDPDGSLLPVVNEQQWCMLGCGWVARDLVSVMGTRSDRMSVNTRLIGVEVEQRIGCVKLHSRKCHLSSKRAFSVLKMCVS